MSKILFVLKDTEMIDRMGIMFLSAMLKSHNHKVKCCITSKGDIVKTVREFNPDIIAYSITTGEHDYYIRLNNMLKENFSFISIFGGPHPTFFPEMIDKEGVDIICRGEGEYPLLELADRIENKEKIDDIKNLWIKRDGTIIKNDVRELIGDLDSIPFPDRDVVYDSDSDLKNNTTKIFFSGRGCPFNCTYCFNHKFNALYFNKGKIVRKRSVKNVIQEILDVKKRYNMSFVYFDDDTFIIDKKWLKEFSREYKENINLPFACNVRANLIDDETVRFLKDANCQTVWMGIECGNEKIRNNLLKRGMTDEQIINAVRMLKRNGIKVVTQNILCLPVKNPLKIDLETLNLNIKCSPDFAGTSILYPYPTTEIGDYSIKNGMFDGNFNDICTTNKLYSVLKFQDERLKRQSENLHKLFAIAVRFPFSLPLIKFLIKLPPNKVFNFIFYGWYAYCWKFKIEKVGGLRNFIRLANIFVVYFITINRENQRKR